jgi:hypothetical protein
MRLFDSVTRWLSEIPVVRRSRVGPRVHVNEQVPLRVGGHDELHFVLLLDVSAGGACIRSDMRLTTGEKIWLRVNAGTKDQFEMTATVISVRTQPLGFYTDYGLRLAELSLSDVRALANFIDRRVHARTAHGGEA